MKIHLISEVHLERRFSFSYSNFPRVDPETVLVLAGGICTNPEKPLFSKFLRTVSKRYHSVVYAPAPGEEIPEGLDDLMNLYILREGGEAMVLGTKFLGPVEEEGEEGAVVVSYSRPPRDFNRGGLRYWLAGEGKDSRSYVLSNSFESGFRIFFEINIE